MKKSKKHKHIKHQKKEEPLQQAADALSRRALKFGYLSVLLGIFVAPVALYLARQAERLLQGHPHQQKIRSRIREARKMAIFGLAVWILVAAIQYSM